MGAIRHLDNSNKGYDALQHAFGERFVNTFQTTEQYATDIQGKPVFPLAIVYPLNEKEVIEILYIANEGGLELYTISGGKNWGYGSEQGTREGQVIIDLSRMNKITEVNEELAYVTLQAGVTQGQLYNYLNDHNSPFQMDVTGAGESASIVGNILERGYGHTEYGDKFSQVINMKVILPDGKIIETGYGGLKNAKAKHVNKYGLGPCIEGLFTQSNFGIITEMTIRLMPRPSYFNFFIARSNNPDAFLHFSEIAKTLQLKNIVTSKMHIVNIKRALGNESGNNEKGWIITGSVSGEYSISKAKQKEVKRLFRAQAKESKVIFFNDRKLRLAKFINDRLLKISSYKDLEGISKLMKGIPTNRPLEVMFGNESINGQTIFSASESVKWINCVCPNKPSEITEVLNSIDKYAQLYNYSIAITLTAISPTSLIILGSIKYKKTSLDEERASAFEKQLKEKLMQGGYFAYRCGVSEYRTYKNHIDGNYSDFLKKLKSLADPNEILSPGKYNL